MISRLSPPRSRRQSSPAPRGTAVPVSAAVLALMLGTGMAAAPAHGAAPSGPEKFVLVYKADTGQTARVRGEALLNTEIRGNKLTFTNKQVSKITFTKVAPNGDITFEDLTEDSQVAINGQPAPNDDKPETDTITIHPDGTLVSYKEGGTDKDEEHLNERLYVATSPIFVKKPVGVGDKWSYDYSPNTDLGTPKAHADFEIVGTEKIKDIDTVKIQMTYAEDNGSQNITGKGTVWVEKASGDPVRSDFQIDGVPFGPPEAKAVASGRMAEERSEGGPLVASGKAGDAPIKKDKTIDDVVKDYEKLPGIVTLYRKREGGKDTIYAELREDQIGKLMMLQATASTGTAAQIVEGDPIDDLVFKFIQTPDDRIVLSVPNYSYRADPNTPVGRSVRRSFADAMLQSFKIEAKQPDRKSLLIDVSDFFKSDISQVSQAFNPPLIPGLSAGGGGYAMDREKTYIQSLKNFPENLVVSTQYNFVKMGPRSPFGDGGTLADPRSAAINVTYNLCALPNDPVTFASTNGYKPRLYDPRIGYFTGSENLGPNFQTFDDDSKEDPYVYYITRWDLRKKDPSAALSEPVQPIVFWIDNAVPVEYRDAVRAGLTLWNKAFEKIGYKDAIVVKQMPDNPDPKDGTVPTDTGDMRFNMIRWVTSPAGGYAVSLFRTNPLTGQILNASITVDAGLIHFSKLEHQSFVEPAAAFEAGAGIPVEQQALAQKAAALAAQKAGVPVSPLSPAQRALFGTDPRYCQFAAGLKDQAWYGEMALEFLAPGGFTPAEQKSYINQYIRHVVSHEMGHIMGLRHNFAASTQYSLAQLGDAALTNANGTVASVMDYTPFNVSAIKKKGVPYFSPTLGAYDYWAIQYGYEEIPGTKTPQDETPALTRVASQSGLPGHAYASDETADQFDPLVTRFDLSSDPIAYWQKNLDISRYLLVNLSKRLPRNGESYWEFTRAFDELVGQYAHSAGVASRYIGGLNYSRTQKGDKGEKAPLQPIDVAKQKQALAMLNTYLFSPDALQFPLSYYTKLTPNPKELSMGDDFPIQDSLANLQRTALRRIFSGSVLDRVANNEFKMGGDPQKALRLVDMFNSVSTNVWSEVDAHKNVPTLRRQLQRAYVDTMIDLATRPGTAPEDARMLAWDQLRQLKSRLTSAEAHPAAGASYDPYTRVHLAESLAKVNRALNASLTIGGSQPSGGNLLQMLLGGTQPNTGN